MYHVQKHTKYALQSMTIWFLEWLCESKVCLHDHCWQISPTKYLPCKAMLSMRKFNSKNNPVKAKFAYMVSIGRFHLQGNHLVKLWTLGDDSAMFRNILGTYFWNAFQ